MASPCAFITGAPLCARAPAPRAATPRPRVFACADPGASRAARLFEKARDIAHSAGLSSDKVRELAKRAMGHKGDALDKVDALLGKAGLSASTAGMVHGLLEKVDLEALVVSGDDMRVKVVDVERAIMAAAEKMPSAAAELGEGGYEGVKDRLIKALDKDGDGHVSKEELMMSSQAVKDVFKSLTAVEESGAAAAEG